MRKLALTCWIALAACTERSPALIVNITSSLEIGVETNSLFVRVNGTEGGQSERTYSLGEPPRDAWPQVLPILTDRATRDVRIEAELRNSRPGAPSVAVGYGTLDALIPTAGESSIDMEIPRACLDRDRDGYGIGFGCLLPDCDDTRADVPKDVFCPGPEAPDAGPPPDAGPLPDAGPNDDAAIDEDASTPPAPDAGTFTGFCTSPSGTNDNGDCMSGEVCLDGFCRRPCTSRDDCPGIAYGCIPPPVGVCICGVPCENNIDCGPFRCVNECCEP